MSFESFVRKAYNRIKNRRSMLGYNGDYKTWADAENDCEGYDKKAIIDKVSKATMAVINKEASYERDGVLFYSPQPNYPIVTWLSLIYKECGKMNLIDFGGALGSTFFQNREYLDKLGIYYSWYVMEQPHFVDYGKENINVPGLCFVHEYKEISDDNGNILLLSSVLQYIENWQELLTNLMGNLKPPYIVIDRTPVGSKNRIMKETVREPIYDATYALRIIAEDELMTFLAEHNYKKVDVWDSMVDSQIYDGELVATFRGYVFKYNKTDEKK